MPPIHGDLKSEFRKNELHAATYKTVWSTLSDAKKWADDAYNGLNPSKDFIVENEIIKCINATAVKYIDLSYKNELISILWVAQNALSSFNSVAAARCLMKITELEGININIAKAILNSQSNSGDYSNGFISNCDIELIISAINMLKAEKNGQKEKAQEIIGMIKNMPSASGLIKNYI